ncbi:NADH:ubiquinone reductase (Na(+)-transporting) subunit C [Aliidiomarina halalkaliphila]|uniref:Na(+)-translocating NADH-quinone reductase subunit C n=1 Tax=Aliidiomarina halalkaliphila TaxID=2593535 RepID=A0A552X2R5_9GAMM|nr:NADH:ubiquinone reductase (Na(+)-transporting) subunit C [Aliidiomarina halalkaliphila]TRW49304.1 NADH:ubiquinone reductase (Na(+)-transporting) subunit C [Aliidiomarina halalkaliphila]
MASKNDTMGKTFTVIILLCLVCSIIVSGAAVGLKERQEANAALAKQQNILRTANVDLQGRSADVVFAERVRLMTFNRDTEELTEHDSLFALEEALAASSAKDGGERASAAGVRGLRADIPVYVIQGEDNGVASYVIDIRGSGLWGMMYAFLSVDPDGQTIRGINFYEHSETPGLGGEIQNPRWRSNFDGKNAIDSDGNVAIRVRKGAGDNEVDALSGATITSDGVDKTFQFWLSQEAYGAFLMKVREEGAI